MVQGWETSAHEGQPQSALSRQSRRCLCLGPVNGSESIRGFRCEGGRSDVQQLFFQSGSLSHTKNASWDFQNKVLVWIYTAVKGWDTLAQRISCRILHAPVLFTHKNENKGCSHQDGSHFRFTSRTLSVSDQSHNSSPTPHGKNVLPTWCDENKLWELQRGKKNKTTKKPSFFSGSPGGQSFSVLAENVQVLSPSDTSPWHHIGWVLSSFIPPPYHQQSLRNEDSHLFKFTAVLHLKCFYYYYLYYY